MVSSVVPQVKRRDLAVVSNVPLLGLFRITLALRMRGIPYLFWSEDVYSDASRAIARHRHGQLGGLAGWLAGRLERNISRGSAAIVPITERSIKQLDAWGWSRMSATVGLAFAPRCLPTDANENSSVARPVFSHDRGRRPRHRDLRNVSHRAAPVALGCDYADPRSYREQSASAA
jgi:hypothetical protein